MADAVKRIFFAILIAGLTQLPTLQAASPNVLFISVDDLRPQLGSYGHDFMVTPHMDRLATEGRQFNRHYVHAPTCGASRYALWSGQLPKRKASMNNGAFKLYANGQAPKSLPQVFRENGYRSVQVGKLSHSPDGYRAQRKGFRYYPAGDQRELPEAWDEISSPPGKWKTPWFAFFGYAGGDTRRKDHRPPFESAEVDDHGYPDALLADEAIKQLRQLNDGDQPFFLALGFYRPHLPFNAPQKYWDLYDRDAIDISNVAPLKRKGGEFWAYDHQPSQAADADYVRTLRHSYYAATSYIDAQIGKVLSELDKLGLRDDTIVVLWGDHGYHLGELGYWAKHTPYEYSLHSPLIVRAPAMQQHAGRATDALTSTVDIYPSLIELAGLPMPDHLDGHSFVPMLKDPQAKTRDHALSFLSHGNNPASFRTDRYRLIGDDQLYDHQTDPGETTNIAAKKPEIVKKLIAWRRAALEKRKAR